jgi:hypothetical protein
MWKSRKGGEGLNCLGIALAIANSLSNSNVSCTIPSESSLLVPEEDRWILLAFLAKTLEPAGSVVNSINQPTI